MQKLSNRINSDKYLNSIDEFKKVENTKETLETISIIIITVSIMYIPFLAYNKLRVDPEKDIDDE